MGEYQGAEGRTVPHPSGGWSVYQGSSHTFWKVTCHTHGPVRGHRALCARERVHPRGPAGQPFLSLALCSASTGVVTTQVCLYVSEGNSVLREYISWEKPALLLVKVPPPPPQDSSPGTLQEPLFQRDLSLCFSFSNPKMTLRNLDFFCLKNKQTKKSVGPAHVGSSLKGPNGGA